MKRWLPLLLLPIAFAVTRCAPKPPTPVPVYQAPQPFNVLPRPVETPTTAAAVISPVQRDEPPPASDSKSKPETPPVQLPLARSDLLSTWHFDDGVTSDEGDLPLEALSIRRVPSFTGDALAIGGDGPPSRLKIRFIEENGRTNLDVVSGAIRFDYQPNWFSGSSARSPHHPLRLIDAGDLRISIGAGGEFLSLETRDRHGAIRTNVTVRLGFVQRVIPFDPNRYWHEIVANYSPAGSWIAVDGVLRMDAATGNIYGKGTDVRGPGDSDAGFSVGSALDGEFPAEGLLDNLETFAQPVGPLQSRCNQEQSVLWAVAQDNPPALEFHWMNPPDPRGDCVVIRRRDVTDGGPDLLLTNVCRTTVWTDSTIQPGHGYEYHIGQQVIFSGIRARPIEDRGRLILLVDETLAGPLAGPLSGLEEDLVCDGWEIVRHNVARHDDAVWSRNPPQIQEIKRLIRRDYSDDPKRTRAVFIVGHVAIPYSGAAAEDGHVGKESDPNNHYGAWPADSYYGDVDGIWTDRSIQYTNHLRPNLQNLIGDGKFDNNEFGTNSLEMSVGRVDFFNLAGQPLSEEALLRRYLEKDHQYRYAEWELPPGVMTGTYFGSPFHAAGRKTFENAWRLGTRIGAPVREGNLFEPHSGCWWGVQGAFGGYHILVVQPKQIDSRVFTKEQTEPKIAFYILAGSFFGDWNSPDNLLRSALAGPRYGLAAMWGHQTDWRFESMALGGTLGDGLVRSSKEPIFLPSAATSVRSLAILGDPTLRAPMVPPPGAVNGRRNNDGSVTLEWVVSREPGAVYQIYQSQDGMVGPWIPVLSRPSGKTSAVDAAPSLKRPALYQVRAMHLVETGSGSYTNTSQGVLCRIP